MKKFFLQALLILLSINSFAQNWGNWVNVGQDIEVSFAFSPKGCNGYTYARIRNASVVTKHCEIRISFTLICNGKNSTASVSAYNLGTNEVSEAKGNWYNADKITDIKLTKLTDRNCKDVFTNRPTSGGVSEISYPKKSSTEEELLKKKKEDEAKQKIKEQQDLEKQAYQNVLNAERNQQAQQAQQQKQIADDNKRKQDEYNKQQQIKAEKARNEQNTIEQNYSNSLNNTANNKKELNKNLNDFSNSYLDKQKNERQEQENNSIQYEKNLQNEKLNSGGYTSVTCSQCDGNGSIKCSECNGKGVEKCIYCSGKGKNNCGYCQGTKVWNNATCVFCGGEGTTSCTSCFGKGFKDCLSCNGQGQSKCTKCNGIGTSTERNSQKNNLNYSNTSKQPTKIASEKSDELYQAEMYLLAHKYYEEKNWEKALEYFTLSAHRGSGYAYAWLLLGYMYRDGKGTPQNFTEAFNCFYKARDLDFSMFSLGVAYEMGLGVEKDIQQADDWYTKAAEKGFEKAKMRSSKFNSQAHKYRVEHPAFNKNVKAYATVKISARFEGKVAIEDSIIFRSNTDGQLYSFMTDSKGIVTAKLPVGHDYSIFLPEHCDEVDSSIHVIDLRDEIEHANNTLLEYEPFNFDLSSWAITFEKNNSKLLKEYDSFFKEFTDVCLKTKNNNFYIIKYSTKDQKPGSKYFGLSLKRAKIVMNYLIQNGISKERIIIKPLGVKDFLGFDDSVELDKIISR